ncbi:MAG: acylneuraminate cytidylyltransferase family protein [Bacteroidia bacterium]|nr:acylneuraminate cytidylyltransferase family protein [Bacteroidia bacterium]
MKILGLITSRSGSKGILGKNTKLLAGQPLLSYSITAAIETESISKVIVSTDSDEIANVALKWGAEVPFIRPDELALYTTPTLPVIQHALKFYRNEGKYFDAVCLLQPTNPFRPKGFIQQCIQKFITTNADSLISVLKVTHEFNPHWTFELDSSNFLTIATGETDIIPRRQELPTAYYRDGSVYITKTNMIESENKLVGGKIAFLESNPDFYCNLDTPSDWEIATNIIRRFKK